MRIEKCPLLVFGPPLATDNKPCGNHVQASSVHEAKCGNRHSSGLPVAVCAPTDLFAAEAAMGCFAAARDLDLMATGIAMA
jgi:hypothetical protein